MLKIKIVFRRTIKHMSSNIDKRGASRDSRERSLYKRDTILMICALLILFLSPFAISIYSNYKESMQMEQYTEQIGESLATSSDAAETAPSETEAGE